MTKRYIAMLLFVFTAFTSCIREDSDDEAVINLFDLEKKELKKSTDENHLSDATSFLDNAAYFNLLDKNKSISYR